MKHLYAERGRAQLKIQETAFMLLGLALLFGIILIIYANMQVKTLYAEKNQLKAEKAINLLQKLTAMPELSCINGNCLDLDKVLSIRNVSGYENLWRGLSSIKVVTIYPNQSIITVYDKGKKDITYSSYVPLCKTTYMDGYVWQDCDIAKLLVSIEEVKVES
jgi:hypothetical protein